MDYKHRSILDTLPNYKQGKPAPALDGIRAYKISSNENPYEPLQSVKEAISNRASGGSYHTPFLIITTTNYHHSIC